MRSSRRRVRLNACHRARRGVNARSKTLVRQKRALKRCSTARCRRNKRRAIRSTRRRIARHARTLNRCRRVTLTYHHRLRRCRGNVSKWTTRLAQCTTGPCRRRARKALARSKACIAKCDDHLTAWRIFRRWDRTVANRLGCNAWGIYKKWERNAHIRKQSCNAWAVYTSWSRKVSYCKSVRRSFFYHQRRITELGSWMQKGCRNDKGCIQRVNTRISRHITKTQTLEARLKKCQKRAVKKFHKLGRCARRFSRLARKVAQCKNDQCRNKYIDRLARYKRCVRHTRRSCNGWKLFVEWDSKRVHIKKRGQTCNGWKLFRQWDSKRVHITKSHKFCNGWRLWRKWREVCKDQEQCLERCRRKHRPDSKKSVRCIKKCTPKTTTTTPVTTTAPTTTTPCVDATSVCNLHCASVGRGRRRRRCFRHCVGLIKDTCKITRRTTTAATTTTTRSISTTVPRTQTIPPFCDDRVKVCRDHCRPVQTGFRRRRCFRHCTEWIRRTCGTTRNTIATTATTTTRPQQGTTTTPRRRTTTTRGSRTTTTTATTTTAPDVCKAICVENADRSVCRDECTDVSVRTCRRRCANLPRTVCTRKCENILTPRCTQLCDNRIRCTQSCIPVPATGGSLDVCRRDAARRYPGRRTRNLTQRIFHEIACVSASDFTNRCRNQVYRGCRRACRAMNRNAAQGRGEWCNSTTIEVCIRNSSRTCMRQRTVNRCSRRCTTGGCRRQCVNRLQTQCRNNCVTAFNTRCLQECQVRPTRTCRRVCRVQQENRCERRCRRTTTTLATTTPFSSTTTRPQQRQTTFSSSAAAFRAGGSNAGLVVGLVAGAAVAAGIAAVAIGFFASGSAGTAAAPLTQSLMAGANVSPLYTADLATGSNAMF